MASLTVGGVDFAVVEGTWNQLPSLYQGGRARMRANNLLSTETSEIRIWECEVDFIDSVEEDAARDVLIRGVPLTMSGDLPGITVDVIADLGQSTTHFGNLDGVDVFWRTAKLHLEEVEVA